MDTKNQEKKRTFRQKFLDPLVIPLLAIFTSLIIVAIVIIITSDSIGEGFEKVGVGYWGIVEGALLSPRGLMNTIVATVPLILTGLAVAIPFHAGLFNIGAQGQFMIGALLGTLAGIYLDLPAVIHVIVVLIAGFVGGMLWGLIPGVLRAWLGSHEVINTIMLNYIAYYFVDMLVRNPLKDPNPSTVQTLPIADSAELLRIPFPGVANSRLHLGVFLAVLVAIAAWYFLYKTTWGFSLRTTGFNPFAAEYAGIRPKREYIISMMIGGAMAGLAGIIEVQGLSRHLPVGFYAAGYGFTAIAVALLALNNPLAVIPGALIFGFLTTGGDFLQIRAGLSVHIVSIFRALILLFVAAPEIVRFLYRRKGKRGEEEAPHIPQTHVGG